LSKQIQRPAQRIFALALNDGNLSSAAYSIFDSVFYESREAKRLFSQEKTTSHNLKMATYASKML
jgi:hypothetical protein